MQSSSYYDRPDVEISLDNLQNRAKNNWRESALGRSDSGWRSLLQTTIDLENDPETRESRRVIQDGFPTFVPTFSWLRSACVDRTREQLQSLEAQIKSCAPGPDRDALLDQAISQLHSLERQMNAIKERHQLQDPEHAAQRGLSVTHFNIDSGPWMMLASDGGVSARSITEWNPDNLSHANRRWLTQFCGGYMPNIVAYKRKKTMIERQRGSVRLDRKIVVPNPRMKTIWRIIINLEIFVLFGLFAVGLIATTTEFSENFVKYFFWICILWILLASTLLVFIVRHFGANSRDALSAFLASVAIWLVIVQIGQTKLNGQLGINS